MYASHCVGGNSAIAGPGDYAPLTRDYTSPEATGRFGQVCHAPLVGCHDDPGMAIQTDTTAIQTDRHRSRQIPARSHLARTGPLKCWDKQRFEECFQSAPLKDAAARN